MKEKISTGIWFIFFGIIALLHNFDVIRFNFWAILPYWPLLVISLGVNLIFQNKKNGTLPLSIINIGLCLYLGYVGMTSDKRLNMVDHITKNENIDSSQIVPSLISPFSEGVENVKLNLNIGAVALQMDSIPSSELLQASTSQNIGLKINESEDNTDKVIDISSVVKGDTKNNPKITFSLNENPTWDMEINMGAASFIGDFSKYKLANLTINSGAARINFKLGMPINGETTIELNSAASSCQIALPKDAACRVLMSTLLSSNKLEGFEKVGDSYETLNYEAADKKYIINFTGAANSLKINSY